MRRDSWMLSVAVLLAFAGAAPGSAQCVGACGTSGANGDVGASPAGPTYQYVTTYGGTYMGGLSGIGGTNGSTFTTSLFSANAGDMLNFYFDYITSDGSGFADYAWAQLLNSDMSQAALLFTARTEPSGSIVPGQGMPAPTATLSPTTVAITPGATNWSPLGFSSGNCFDTGCGNTGWISSQYTIGTAGNYYLAFGVTNWQDNEYDSGLAWAGAQVGGVPIPSNVTPEPVTILLLATGLLGIGIIRRRKTRKQSLSVA